MDYKAFDTRDIILENGLRVITVRRDTRLASLHCGVKIGPLLEKKGVKGISHFIEHMLFKGTATRSNEELNSALENLGGEYNAYTDYTCTVYSLTVLEEELENSCAIISDMILNSNFPQEEIEKERGVILAEIRTSKDDVEDYSFRMINRIGFANSALKYDIIGEESTVKRFKKTDLEKFYKQHYVANNSCITIVSSMEHEAAIDMVKKYFSSWKSKDLHIETATPEDNIPIKEITFKNDIEQSTITYLYTFHNLKKESELALKILNHKLGESANSILFRELREDRGLAYDVYTHMDMSSSIKTLYIYTAVSEENVEEAINVIDNCISRIKNEEIVFNDDTVALMKKVLKTAVASTMEDSTDLGNYILHQCLEGEDIYGFLEDMKNMEKIKQHEIYETARCVFNSPTIHILKPRTD